MKKWLILVMVLGIGCLTYADNTLQTQYESTKPKSTVLIDNFYLIKQDYETYKNTNNESVYRDIAKRYTDAPSNEKKYYKQIMDNLSDAVMTNSVIKPIIIEDEVYKTFSEDLKSFLSMYNTFIDRPIEISDYEDEEYNLTNIKDEEEKLKNIPEAKHTRSEKISYGVGTTLLLPFSILGNTLTGDFKRVWESPDLKADYDKQLENRKNIIENEKQEIKNRKEKTLKVLYLRAFEDRAYNTAVMVANNTLTYANKDYTGEQLLNKIETTDKEVEKLYSSYKTNPSDMKRNIQLIKLMGTSKGGYTSCIEGIEKDFIEKAYETYSESYNLQKERKIINNDIDLYFDDSLDDIILKDKEYFTLNLYDTSKMIQAYDLMIDKINKYDEYAADVSKYSYNYERQQYQKGLVKNGKKQVKGTLEQFVYGSHYQPQQGALYTHHPTNNLFLKVLQTVPGGVILTGTYIGHNVYGQNLIFLQTSKSFADGQYIREPLTAEFKGYYDYTTVLGAHKRIYKFYRLGQNEINANFKIPGQTFYFYEP